MRPILTVLLCVTASLPAAGQEVPGPATPLSVEYVVVETRPLTLNLRLTGSVAAKDSINLAFPNGGRVVEMLVEAGDRVTTDQPLARIEAVQARQALAQAEAGVVAAEAAERQARQAADRADEMLRRGVGTRAARDSAQQALSAAEGELERARTAAEQARRADDDTVLKAPQDAVVTARSAEPGQVVGAAQPILSLAALTGLEAIFQVPDSPKLDRANGATVELRPLDHPDRQLGGKVTEIAPLVDSATGSVTIRVAIDGGFDPALLGAAVVGVIHLPAGEGVALPWTALTVSQGAPAVWKIGADDTVRVAPIEIERFDTGVIVVSSGLAPGEVVVGEGSQLMYPGRKVARGTVRP